MSGLKNRVRRLSRGAAFDRHAWIDTISKEELLFLIYHDSKAILANPAIAAEDRAEVAATLDDLPPPPCIDEQRAAVLIARSAALSGRHFNAV